MKTYSIILLIAALAVTGGCSSAYRSGQTPDAVYYSPARENAGNASSDQQVAVARDDNPDAGRYITYDDGDKSSYADNDYYDDYYTQRINMFDRPGSLYAFNSYYGLGGLGYYGSPYLGYYSSPYMSLGNPFSWSYPFLSLGLNFGSPWGGWYSPMYSYGGYYSPYYAGYLNGYMSGYYGGGYGYGYGGYYGKVINRNPRPAVSYGPRRSVNSRAATAVSRSTGTSGANVSSPRRVFRTTGNTGQTGVTTSHPRRVFKSSPGEHPVNVNTSTRVVEKQPKVRIFRRSNTTTRSSDNNRVETYRPRRETRVVQPRTYENNTRSVPSFNSGAESHSAPVRTFSPRGRR